MTEREKFLERWSRRKREQVGEPAKVEPQNDEAEKKPETGPSAVGAEADKPFDIESLPSLESIAAETDIRDFLRPGVPADLQREALRRAWSTDPGIRDFIGLAENSGDFNDPTSMIGFGPIEPSEVARLMAQFVLTPAEEKKVARAPDPSTDQDDTRPGADPEQVAKPKVAGESAEEKTEYESHVASQDIEDESDVAPQDQDNEAEPKANNAIS
jgi:hypothetical protein